ncbi:hypothetical protein DACRYDRAFT_116261 [Dacryopinax primogenitus]|uniref:NAD(P)-binding domain-containing protein n=1 Tax=Dacryopinax primogenitus (strain DJM 731) TaxID=1858805 RepID=M5FVI5_DACPD|nr:uncharacterized protein DACRYDRAFT_116261 [Dacryopinax primogenitus]EJU01826.1 hypothetical protein DACRYDRAFT_116261 [Dacryopinax primogenitus]
MSTKTALLIGATGNVGSHLLRELLASPHFSKVGEFGRHVTPADKVPTEGKAKLEQHTIDFENLGQAGLEKEKWDVVFVTLGTTRQAAGSAEKFTKIDKDYVVDAAKHAFDPSKQQRMVYLSSEGANAKSSFLYLRSKGETELALAQMGYAETIVFRPGFLQGATRSTPRYAEAVLAALVPALRLVWSGAGMHIKDVAKAMRIAGDVGAANLPKQVGATKVDGFTLISNQGATVLSKTDLRLPFVVRWSWDGTRADARLSPYTGILTVDGQEIASRLLVPTSHPVIIDQCIVTPDNRAFRAPFAFQDLQPTDDPTKLGVIEFCAFSLSESALQEFKYPGKVVDNSKQKKPDKEASDKQTADKEATSGGEQVADKTGTTDSQAAGEEGKTAEADAIAGDGNTAENGAAGEQSGSKLSELEEEEPDQAELIFPFGLCQPSIEDYDRLNEMDENKIELLWTFHYGSRDIMRHFFQQQKQQQAKAVKKAEGALHSKRLALDETDVILRNIDTAYPDPSKKRRII